VFPTCFVCGPAREAGDGLRIYAGNVAGTDHVAAPWTPDVDLADGDGIVKAEFIWSALDCPGGYAVIDRIKAPAVLGRMSAKILRPLRPGQPCVVLGWPLSSEGKKHFAATALYSAEGELIGCARATWFVLKD
jgi:acyl-coenzyme A thioesterase PaaI-like protein